jgi:SAM-dependent methyltransferase
METGVVDFEVGGVPVRLKTAAGTFLPNITTKLLGGSVDIEEGDTVLDLGCGIGPLAILAAKRGARHVVATDIMPEACRLTEFNARLNGVGDRVRVVESNLFEGIGDRKFDVIIDDVSGVAEKVARISPWFDGDIPTGGDDGTEQTIDMLTASRSHLREGGTLYFPVLSLSDAGKIRRWAMQTYGKSVKLVAEKWVPFCREFKEGLGYLEELKAEGIIDYVTRRSRQLWHLQIYRAQWPPA